jgi:hypothetical protein
MKKITNYFLLKRTQKTNEKKSFVEFLCMLIIVMSLLMAFYSLTFMYFNVIIVGILSFVSFLGILGILFLFKTKTKVSTIANLFMTLMYVTFVVLILLTGNTSSPFIPLLIIFSVCSFVTFKNLNAFVWTIFAILFYTVLLVISEYEIVNYNAINNDSRLSTLIAVQLVMYIAICTIGYIAWMKMYKNDTEDVISKKYAFIKFTEIELLIMDWNFLKYKFSKKFNSQIEVIENLEFLTPHEKKYTLIDYFKLDLILIAETLNVSTRTVETNYYRIRKKLKENNRQEKFPYHKIK